MSGIISTPARRALLVALLLCPLAASAGIHTWDVNEVFSNTDGTIQFVELWEANGTPGETGVGNGSLSSGTHPGGFSWTQGAVTPPTSNKFYLIATAGYAALPGAPTPDVIIPAGLVPFFNPNGDTVSFGGFDSWVFGAVPTNGKDSLDRFTGAGTATATNYAGVTLLPLLPLQALLGLGALLFTAGIVAMVRQRRQST